MLLFVKEGDAGIMQRQAVDSRDLTIFFDNMVYRNPKNKAFEKKLLEHFTKESAYCKVCGFHSRRHIVRTNRGNTVIICLSCGNMVWRIPKLKCIPLL